LADRWRPSERVKSKRKRVVAVTARPDNAVEPAQTGNPPPVVALGVALLLTSCSARAAASLLARGFQAAGSGAGGANLAFGGSLLRKEMTYVLRIAASHASLFVVLLVLARGFADSGNARVVICAYLCVGIAVLGAAIWIIAARLSWKRASGYQDAPRAAGGRLPGTGAARFALLQRGSLLASLLTLAAAAALLVQPQPVIG
jgi:hypothetical protein